MENYIIYKHTNKINGKVYIGQTKQKPEYRWNYGYGYKNCPLFYNAIKKYGWDNFQHTILFIGLNKKQANDIEKSLIEAYKANNDDYGYNLAEGGYDTDKSIQIVCLETEKVYKNATICGEELNIDKTHIRGCCRGERLTAGGYHFDYYNLYLEKIEADKDYRAKKINVIQGRSIICVETGKIYRNITEARDAIGLKSSSTMTYALKNKNHTAGGYHWQYYNYFN